MEERNRIIDFFYKQLEILKSEHVEDLMKARRSKELERILKKKKFRFDLGMVGFGVIIFIGLLICVLPN